MATFIDFSKAFDSIARTRVEEVLHNCGLPAKIVAAVMSIYVLRHNCTSCDYRWLVLI